MKAVRVTGIILICLQLICFLGNSNSSVPINLKFESFGQFLGNIFFILGYCFIGIIGILFVVWSFKSENDKTKQHSKIETMKDDQEESNTINMIQTRTNSLENNVINIVVCPKCNIQLSDDSVFCPNCGCNIEEEKKQIITEQVAKPEIKVVEKVVEKVVVKKNKTNKILVFFLILSLIASSVLGYYTFTYYHQSENYVKEIRDLTYSNKILMNRYNDTSFARDVLYAVNSTENLGYATENFHTDTGILVLSKYSGAKEITMYSTYSGATFSIGNSDPNVASAVWTEESWHDNTTAIRIKPLETGVSVLTITNNKYDNEVNIIVIVD